MTTNCKLRTATTLVSLALTALLGQTTAMAADGDTCTAITSVPFTITTGGTYCLMKQVSTTIGSGAAITVNADHVTIDLGGHTMGGIGAGVLTGTYGVFSVDHGNITVRNGTIEGFYEGIALLSGSSVTSSHGHLVENIRADFNRYVGIHVQGTGSVVHRNQVYGTGVSVPNLTAFGIVVTGNGVQVSDNSVVDTEAKLGESGIATGILADETTSPYYGVVIEHNSIVYATSSGYGINMFSSALDAQVVNNRIVNFDNGAAMNLDTKYRDNLVSNAAVSAYAGGKDEGNNK